MTLQTERLLLAAYGRAMVFWKLPSGVEGASNIGRTGINGVWKHGFNQTKERSKEEH